METALLVALGLSSASPLPALAIFVARPRRRRLPTPCARRSLPPSRPPRRSSPTAGRRTGRAGPGHGRAARQGADAVAEHGARTARRGDPASRHVDADHDQAHHRNLQKLNERLAVIDMRRRTSPTRLAGDLAAETCWPTSSRAARSARAAWKRSSRTGCRRAPTNSSTRCPTASGRTACVFMPDKRPLVIDAKFPLEASPRSATPRPTTNASSRRSACGRTSASTSTTSPRNI